MNKNKYIVAASLLAVGIAQASSSCEGFEVKIKNQTADDLVVRKIKLEGAVLQPGGIQHLKRNSEEVFTVSNAPKDGVVLKGDLVINSVSLPLKKVHIQFDMVSKDGACKLTDTSPSTDLPLSKSESDGQVKYT